MAAYHDARQRLFTKFEQMKPGAKLKIEKEANGRPDLYIAICKEFIDEGNYMFEFNKDYSYFRRLNNYF